MKPVRALICASLLAISVPAAAQVEVTPLASLDLFSASASDTGLPPTLWRGASAPLARDVFSRIGARPLSPAAQILALRILSTGAEAPPGAGADADLAAARGAALIALGDAAGAARVLDRAPGLARSEPLSRAAAEAFLRTGDDERACQTARDLSTGRDAVYWLRLRAYCQAIGGETDAANLTFTLAGQAERDPVYARLMGALLAGGGFPGAPSYRNGLETSVSRHLGLPAPPEAAKPAPIAEAEFADLVGPSRAAIDGLFEAYAAATAPPAKTRLAGRILLVAALDLPLGDNQRALVSGLDAGRGAAPAGMLLALNEAASEGQVGQTALAALSISLSAGASGPALADRIAIVRALRRAGLSEDARNYALEGLAALRDPAPATR